MKERIKIILRRFPIIYSAIIWSYKNIYKNIRETIFYVFGHLFILLPIKNNKIVICNYYGKGYGDNGKYIAEEIIKQGLDYDIVWLLRKDIQKKANLPQAVNTAKYESIKGLYELATAKVWIDNCRKSFYSTKRKEQYYIQTWHGAIGMKKCEKDAEDVLTKDYVATAIKDSKMINLCISNSNHISNIYKNSFWYSGSILKCGCPRNDILTNNKNKIKLKVYDHFNFAENTKIVLYAPTFRRTGNTDIYNLDYIRVCKMLEAKFEGDWVFLVRLHPNISTKANEMDYNNKIINATHYDDMQELLAASDVLITDYSSCSFDFMLTKRPCFLYVPDMKEYMNDRNFYFSLDALPFTYSVTNQDLIDDILNFNNKEYIEKIDYFYGVQEIVEEGNASERVVNKIKNIIGD